MAAVTSTITASAGGRHALLRLLQLTSPALPVGAYAYSQGLEYAAGAGWLTGAAQVRDWILGLLRHTQAYQDIPVFARLYRAWQTADTGAAGYWNAWLFATRETAELRAEERHLGTALARLLADLDVAAARDWRSSPRVCFATLFSLAAVEWEIDLETAATGYAWTWTGNQVAAATRLMPLGQTAAQQILAAAVPEIAAAVRLGLSLEDDEIGAAAPGLGLASALHETQYSRLFRS